MRSKNNAFRLLSLIISILLLFATIPSTTYAEGTDSFVSENLLQKADIIDTANSMTGMYIWAHNPLAFSSSTRLDGKNVFSKLIDGNLTYDSGSEPDIIAYGNADKRLFGVVYALTGTYYCDNIKIYGGTNDYYRIYASDSMNTLFWNESLTTAITDASKEGTTVKLNRDVKYVALVYDQIRTFDFTAREDASTGRPKEIELWSGNPATRFTPVNLLTSESLTEAKGIAIISSTNNIIDYTSNNSKISNIINGKPDHSHTDINAYNDGNVGFQFSFDKSYYIGDILIDAGLYPANATTSYDETYDIYASNNLSSLYASDSKVAENVLCSYMLGNKVSINKSAQYIAIVNTKHNGIRIRKLIVNTADNSNVFIPENIFRTNKLDLAESSGIVLDTLNSTATDDPRFDSKGALAGAVDGITDIAHDFYAYSPESTKWIGVRYALTEAVYSDKIIIRAGLPAYKDYYRVYASDNKATLFSNTNMVADSIACDGTAQIVAVNKYVKYVAIVYDNISAQSNNARPMEFELWSAEPGDIPVEPGNDELKVLTIGNSFAENASIYASEIAAVNGKALTFGYLKFPSCSLDMHYQAATENLAVFKFRVTNPDGTAVTIKNQAGSFNTPNPETSATILEALQYTDWDVIVFQQESASALNYDSFSNLGNLITYVKGYLPNAKMMFHEVWRWGTWNADQFTSIKKNAERAARENNLEIIPSGLAFEYARESLGSVTAVNENDGNYQHANTYGMYVAGSCFVNAVFGIEIDPSTFSSHIYVNDNGKVALLTAAANDAVDYYNSYGDIDGVKGVTASDLVVLKKHLLTNIAVDTTLADTNNDGFVDLKDLVRLKKYLADNTVVLG